jgi:hypothetical protein
MMLMIRAMAAVVQHNGDIYQGCAVMASAMAAVEIVTSMVTSANGPHTSSYRALGSRRAMRCDRR